MTQLLITEAETRGQLFWKYTRNLLPASILLILILLGWEVVTHVFDIHPVILPAPSRILQVIFTEHSLLVDDMLFTLQEVLLGFAIGFIAGLVLAIMIVYSPILERSIYPLVVASQTIPVFAIAPLLVIWFGFGILPKVLIAALIVFFPICVSEIEGLRSAEPEMIDLLRSLSTSRWKIFRLVEFPASIPYLMAGTQIGIAYSTIGAVIGEWVGSNKGIGELMLAANAMLRTDLVFAAIVVLSVVTLALFISVSVVSRLLMPWRYIKS
jgi:ABC-type nitrate/sulfonate/bicarbonate transport system permease component